METAAEDGTYFFKLTQLHDLYEKRLKEFNLDISVNKTRLKEQLLNHFKIEGLQQQSDGRLTILAFPEGIQQMLKDEYLYHDYDDEALLLAKVAKLCKILFFCVQKHKSCAISKNVEQSFDGTAAPSRNCAWHHLLETLLGITF